MTCRDLSVRLHYAGVDHVMEPDPLAAVRAAATKAAVRTGATVDPARVDVIGNYTAFDELLGVSVTRRPGS